MEIRAYKTPKVVVGDDLLTILDHHIPKIPPKSIVVVTSKIVSICQGRVIKNDGTVNKHELIRKEADQYIDSNESRYDVYITIKNDTLIANGGIDESNGGGYFILWPENIQDEAKKIWRHLCKRDGLTHLGVVITDSRATPLRWGTLGVSLAWCGFEPLKNYIGTPDIFGRTLRMTKQSIVDGLAASAVLLMGEGNEQTPLVMIQDVPFVTFRSDAPTQKEIKALRIQPKNDLFAPLIDSPKWKRGG